jgi:hypothetical protein
LVNKNWNILFNGITVGAVADHEVKECITNPATMQKTCTWHYAVSTDRTLDWTGRDTHLGTFTYTWANPDPGFGPQEVGDLELPQMTAYAEDMTDSFGPSATNCGESGTSFSAPLVTGAAALVSEANGELYGRPEALRAVLYAGADANTDLSTPGLGAAYTYYPVYNNIGSGGKLDRHGGMGLMNVYASAQIAAPSSRLHQNARYGLPFNTALAYAQGGAALTSSSPLIKYQHGLDATIQSQALAPGMNGHDYGVMDPVKDFNSIWYKNFYYFSPTESGSLRVVLTWNRPYLCKMNPTSCGAYDKPELDMVLRDLAAPAGPVGTAAAWDPAEQFMSVPVKAGHAYRLDIYKQGPWPGPESFALASYLTTNPQ